MANKDDGCNQRGGVLEGNKEGEVQRRYRNHIPNELILSLKVCINSATENLQYYVKQHVLNYQQKEYRKEGTLWTNIDSLDNTACLQLIEGKPHGLLCLIGAQCKDNTFYVIPQRREVAFLVRKYAGQVDYQLFEMRAKNLDLMRQDIVSVQNSRTVFVTELVGADPVAVFFWAFVRAFFRVFIAFHEADHRHGQGEEGNIQRAVQPCYRNHIPNELILRFIEFYINYAIEHLWYYFNQHVLNYDDQDYRNEGTRWTNINLLDNTACLQLIEGTPIGLLCLLNAQCKKNWSFQPMEQSKKGLKNLQTVKTLVGCMQSHSSGQQPGKARKQLQTITAQFQQSLHSLMDTLHQANPFLIRCIKSNIPNKFDDETVQRQLRYTGMMETVCIRQAGYNICLTYDEFIQLYRILLPKGLIRSQTQHVPPRSKLSCILDNTYLSSLGNKGVGIQPGNITTLLAYSDGELDNMHLSSPRTSTNSENPVNQFISVEASRADVLVKNPHISCDTAKAFNKLSYQLSYSREQINSQAVTVPPHKPLKREPRVTQNGDVQMPCPQHIPGGGKPETLKNIKNIKKPYDMNKLTGKFNLTRTSEFTDSTDEIISNAGELQLMQDFITKKITRIEEEEGSKSNKVDRVFKQALREFKDNLYSTYSVINKQSETFNIKYKDLIANFRHVMETVCNQEQMNETFPFTMGVNAFRGFMDEFIRNEKPKAKRKKEEKRKIEDPIVHAGHTFLFSMINSRTACEVCSSFFRWPTKKGLICEYCKLTCHKKCYKKVVNICGNLSSAVVNQGGPRVFGVPLHQMAVGDGKVPPILDRLITTIDMYGLLTEGIYRISGVNSKIEELKNQIEEEIMGDVNFENYEVHVLAAVLKSFFHEMPEPLLTFECYEDFLRAANLSDTQDRISTLFAILKNLPKPNFDLMERLILHLARVALHEEANRMNAKALAIVFAPCILRTDKILSAQDALQDIGRQIQCIETIIAEKLRQVKAGIADIDSLDNACHNANHRLSSPGSSKIFNPEELAPMEMVKPSLRTDDEEAMLVGTIQEIQKEKASALPTLSRTTSQVNLESSDMDDGRVGDVTGHIEEVDNEDSTSDSKKKKKKSAIRRFWNWIMRRKSSKKE